MTLSLEVTLMHWCQEEIQHVPFLNPPSDTELGLKAAIHGVILLFHSAFCIRSLCFPTGIASRFLWDERQLYCSNAWHCHSLHCSPCSSVLLLSFPIPRLKEGMGLGGPFQPSNQGGSFDLLKWRGWERGVETLIGVGSDFPGGFGRSQNHTMPEVRRDFWDLGFVGQTDFPWTFMDFMHKEKPIV